MKAKVEIEGMKYELEGKPMEINQTIAFLHDEYEVREKNNQNKNISIKHHYSTSTTPGITDFSINHETQPLKYITPDGRKITIPPKQKTQDN